MLGARTTSIKSAGVSTLWGEGGEGGGEHGLRGGRCAPVGGRCVCVEGHEGCPPWVRGKERKQGVTVFPPAPPLSHTTSGGGTAAADE